MRLERAVCDTWLNGRGVRVLRYAVRDVLTNLEGVVAQVIEVAVSRLDPLKGDAILPLRQLRCHLPLAGED